MINVFSLVLVLLSALCSTTGACLLKRAALIFSFRKPISFSFVLSGAFYVLAMVLFTAALRFEKLSMVYPIAAFQYVFIVLAGVFLFRERLSLLRIMGIVLVVIGVILINV